MANFRDPGGEVADITRRVPRQVARDERGQALVEYALILFLVSVLAFGALSLLGVRLSTMLSGIGSAVGIL